MEQPQRHLDLLHKILLAIAPALDLDQVLTQLIDQLAQVFDASAILVSLTDSNSGLLVAARGSHVTASAATQRDAREVANRPLVWLPDPLPEQAAHIGLPETPRHVLAAALVYSGEAVGLIEIASPHVDGITQEDAAWLELLAPHVAISVTHARMFEDNQEIVNVLQRIHDRSAAVSSVAQSILEAGHDLHRMLADALQRTLSLLGLKSGSILLANPAGRELYIVVHYRFPQDYVVLAPRQTISAASVGLAARAAFEQKPLVVYDVQQDKLTQPAQEVLKRFGIGALAAIPMLVGEQIMGVLLVAAENGRAFEPGALDTLHVLSNILAHGVENARLFSRVRADQEQFTAIIASSGDVVLSLDRQGRITLANQAAQRAFGFEINEVIGQPVAQATTNVAINRAVEQVVRDGTRERIGFEVPLADESVLFCNLSPISEEDGQLIGWVAVMQDITRFKETERMKSDMILTASHDLRNPVNLTLGALDMLRQRAANRLEHEEREVLDLALIGIRRIEALIADLLDLERVERRVGLILRECNLIDIARTVYTENTMQAQSKNQSFEAHLPEQLPAVRGDSERLYQVFSNLVSNAIKYTPVDGRVTIMLQQEDNQILCEVSDTGRGISPDAQARVFERFYRVAGSSTIDPLGTGLGLALVKSIVEQHGGRVWVTSEVGQGSTFSVSLPIWQPPDGGVARAPEAAS
jgi:PAS domain S-box-containing protein